MASPCPSRTPDRRRTARAERPRSARSPAARRNLPGSPSLRQPIALSEARNCGNSGTHIPYSPAGNRCPDMSQIKRMGGFALYMFCLVKSGYRPTRRHSRRIDTRLIAVNQEGGQAGECEAATLYSDRCSPRAFEETRCPFTDCPWLDCGRLSDDAFRWCDGGSSLCLRRTDPE